MFVPAARVFANLAVGKKLFIGFGLVLLLTAAMTGSGFLAVQAVLQGIDGLHGQGQQLHNGAESSQPRARRNVK